MTISTGEDSATLQGDNTRGAIPLDTFGSRLMLARVHAGYITVKDAAERCGLNYGSWSNWERGSRPQDRVEVAQAVSAGLGIDLDWLLFGGPLTTPEPRRQLRRDPRPVKRDKAHYRRPPLPGRRTIVHPDGLRRPVVLRDPLGLR